MSAAQVKIDSTELINNLTESILGFEENFPLEEFKKGDFKQHPLITLLTCSDARMPADMFGKLFNRVFCVENIGNQVKTSEGSVFYGLLHLHTPLMIIAGHTDCGAIRAAESNFVDEPFAIRNDLSVVKNSLEEVVLKSGFQLDQSTLKYSQLAELNVDMQINYLLANNQVANLIQESQLLLLGVFVDLHDVHGNGHGKIYTTNVNGEHKAEVLKSYINLGPIADQAKRLTNY